MKTKLLLFPLIILYFFTISYHAHASSEIILTKIEKILENNSINEYKTLIDLTIDLINKKSDSEEMRYIVNILIKLIGKDKNKITNKIFLDFKNKYPLPINDFETDLAEKIVYSCLLLATSSPNDDPTGSVEQEADAKKILLNVIEKSTQKKYVAVALLLMTEIDVANSNKYFNLLRKNYPDHKSWPFIELDQLEIKLCYIERNFQKYITEVSELAKKYKDIPTPLGHKYLIECYSDIAFTYAVSLKDTQKAKEYLAIIEKNDPNYIFLDWLKKIVQEK